MQKVIDFINLYGQSNLARRMGVSRQQVHEWVKTRKISDRFKVELVTIANGTLKYRDFFRPTGVPEVDDDPEDGSLSTEEVEATDAED